MVHIHPLSLPTRVRTTLTPSSGTEFGDSLSKHRLPHCPGVLHSPRPPPVTKSGYRLGTSRGTTNTPRVYSTKRSQGSGSRRPSSLVVVLGEPPARRLVRPVVRTPRPGGASEASPSREQNLRHLSHCPFGHNDHPKGKGGGGGAVAEVPSSVRLSLSTESFCLYRLIPGRDVPMLVTSVRAADPTWEG